MKKKVLSVIIALAAIASIFCGCGKTPSKVDPSNTGTKQEQPEGGKQDNIESGTPDNAVKATAFPKPSRENKDMLTKFDEDFAAEVRKAYFDKYDISNTMNDFSVANVYGSYNFSTDEGIRQETYVFFAKVGGESDKNTEETVSGVTFRYTGDYRMSVYEAKSKTLYDLSEACEKGLLAENVVRSIKHKCDMEDFAIGDGLPLLETYRKFLGLEDKVDLGRMEILDYFGAYHGVHVAVIDSHYGLHATVYPQYDISGYWFFGIGESTFVAYKDGEMKYMCAPAEKGWYVANEWLTEEDIADINGKHLRHLEYNYD